MGLSANRCLLAGTIALAVVQTLCPGASFQGLGQLTDTGDGYLNWATAVSADGRVVVGESRNSLGQYQAFRWVDGILSGLGWLPGGGPDGRATGVSADGSVVVGWGRGASGGNEAFRWTDGVMSGLGYLTGGSWSQANGVSADGSVVVGVGSKTGYSEGFRWENGGMIPLGLLPTGEYSEALGVSAGGGTIVGQCDAEGWKAFRWSGGAMTMLGMRPNGETSTQACAVSANGAVIVGTSALDAVFWSAGAPVALGHLPGYLGNTDSAYAVSADGGVIVGAADAGSSDFYSTDAFIWDGQMQMLQDVLTNRYGLDLTGWRLVNARGVSADGMTIVGTGYHYSRMEGYIARLGWTLTTNVQGQGNVLRDSDKAGYSTGTVVSLTAQPATGWHFVRWEGQASGTSLTTQVSMTANAGVTAVFEADVTEPNNPNEPNTAEPNNPGEPNTVIPPVGNIGCGFGVPTIQLVCWWTLCLTGLVAMRRRTRRA